MANPEHEAILKEGVKEWNRRRDQGHNLGLRPDLSGIEFPAGTNLSEADFRWTDLSWAKLNEIILARSNLFKANLADAELNGTLAADTDLRDADLRRSKLSGASLNSSNLLMATLTDADLRGADLKMSILVRSKMQGVKLDGALVWGASVWETDLTGASQSNLVIGPQAGPLITTNNLEVAQFLYLLLNNNKIRNAIDTITSKVVLILGRYTPKRKAILDAIRDELRKRDYLPVLFDFDKPSNKSTLETVSTLAHLSRFVIADLTDARSVLQEIQAIAPHNPSVPIQPLLLNSQREPGMFDFFRMVPWVLESFLYENEDHLLQSLDSKVIGPADKKAGYLPK